MRGTALAAALVAIGVSALPAGCGQPATSPGTTQLPRTTQECIVPKMTDPGQRFTITEQDNGKKYCITAGTGIFIFLHGTPERMWAAIHPSSAVLTPRASGEMMLARGVTGRYFVATGLGTATLTSARPPCVAGAMVHCTARTLFKVTVVVRGRM